MFQSCGFSRGAYIDCVRQAVKQISASFKPYTSVQRIAQLWRRIQEIQSELRTMIDADWDKLSVRCSPLSVWLLTRAPTATYKTLLSL